MSVSAAIYYFFTHLTILLDFTVAVKSLPHVPADHGLHLRALVTIDKDEDGVKRLVGEEWQLRGPLTYVPRPGMVVSGWREGEGGIKIWLEYPSYIYSLVQECVNVDPRTELSTCYSVLKHICFCIILHI